MFAYTGRILHVDLTRRTTRVEQVDEDYLKKYVGGVGLVTRLAYDNVSRGADPLGPDNALCFAPGAFVGTLVPVGAKHGVAAKSPMTGFIGDALASSYFSSAIRRAGYDGIVIKGKAEKPTYLFIDDDRVEFRDAQALWGKLTFETEEAIRAEIGDDNVRVSTIGPGGERLVRYANITNDRGRQAGRTGLGAVMGSKLLKALAIRGTQSITVADPQGLCQMAQDLGKKAQGTATEKYRVLGTPSNVLTMDRLGILPTRNYQQGTFEHVDLISGEYMKAHYTEKAVACAGCPIACEQVVRVRDGEYAGARTSIDYESLYAFSSCCGVSHFPAAIHAIQLCDDAGLDTMSTGVTVSWAMECFERGILSKDDFDGLEPNFGNYQAEVARVEKIIRREGIGDLLAEGTTRASARVGKGSDHFAIQSKGLEFPGYDVRGLQTFALGCAVGTRGPCHNRSGAYEPDIQGRVDRFKADASRGAFAMERENYAATFDTLVLCKFIRGCFSDFYKEASAFYTMTTGLEMSADELKGLGERVWNLKKAFNIREGWTRADDWLPPRFLKDPLPGGASKGSVVKPDDLAMMIDSYYAARGWTPEGLIPKDKLIALGLDDLAEEIGV